VSLFQNANYMCEHEFSEPAVANLRFGLVLEQPKVFIRSGVSYRALRAASTGFQPLVFFSGFCHTSRHADKNSEIVARF
jgi:hypothetical protein